MDLTTDTGRDAARKAVRAQVTKVFQGVPVQPAYVKAIANRAEKALNRLLHEVGLPQTGTEIYKPAGKSKEA